MPPRAIACIQAAVGKAALKLCVNSDIKALLKPSNTREKELFADMHGKIASALYAANVNAQINKINKYLNNVSISYTNTLVFKHCNAQIVIMTSVLNRIMTYSVEC